MILQVLLPAVFLAVSLASSVVIPSPPRNRDILNDGHVGREDAQLIEKVPGPWVIARTKTAEALGSSVAWNVYTAWDQVDVRVDA